MITTEILSKIYRILCKIFLYKEPIAKSADDKGKNIIEDIGLQETAPIKIKDDKGKAMAKSTDPRKKIIESMVTPNTEVIENKESNFLDLPPSKNYTYDINQLPFSDSASMYGVFFFDSSSNPSFNFTRPHPPLTLPKPNFYTIPFPFAILSSVNGLILCRDFLNFYYHVCNPFVQTQTSYRSIPPPPRPHESSVPAVLTTANLDFPDPVFYIICLLEDKEKGNGHYTVDAHSSLGNQWFRAATSLHVKSRIVENSGVSDSSGHAYWLTEPPRCIVKLGFATDGRRFEGQIVDLHEYEPGDKMQLGRICNLGVCLVFSNSLDVQFYVLRDEEDDPSSFEYVNYLKKSENSVLLHESLELVRFEKDAAFWVDGRIFFWQVTDYYDAFKFNSLHEMPRWVKIPSFVCDCVPHVFTSVLPWQFLADYDYSDEDEDNCEDEGDFEVLV